VERVEAALMQAVEVRVDFALLSERKVDLVH